MAFPLSHLGTWVHEAMQETIAGLNEGGKAIG
jgi:hypothetical protein